MKKYTKCTWRLNSDGAFFMFKKSCNNYNFKSTLSYKCILYT